MSWCRGAASWMSLGDTLVLQKSVIEQGRQQRERWEVMVQLLITFVQSFRRLYLLGDLLRSQLTTAQHGVGSYGSEVSRNQ